MKALVCEICGSQDLIKQEGMYVCQSCGTKYTVEEAKKMLIEGSVKIDNSDKVANYYKLARTAKDEDDSVNAKKYYELILEEEPLSWEAKFYANYYAAMECKVIEALPMCEKIEKIIPSVLNSLRESVNGEAVKQYIEEIVNKLHILSHMFLMGASDTASDEAINMMVISGDNIERIFPEYANEYAKGFWEAAISALVAKYGTGEEDVDKTIAENKSKILKYDSEYQIPKSKLTRHSSDSPNKVAAKVLKLGHETYEAGALGVQKVFKAGCDEVGHIGAEVIFKNIAGSTIKKVTVRVTPYDNVGDIAPCTVAGTTTYGISFTGPIAVGEKREGFVDGIWYNRTITNAKIARVDVKYMDDSEERFSASDLTDDTQVNSAVSKSGGCYVATAVYGSYDCPQVWTLRRYRDDILAKNWYGRAFIHLYYAFSPTLVKWFGKTEWFKNMWRPRLDHLVKRLNDEGVDNLPYEDKAW